MDTDSFIMNIKGEDIDAGIEKDVEARFDTSNYELDRQKVIGLMKDELGGKIMK